MGSAESGVPEGNGRGGNRLATGAVTAEFRAFEPHGRCEADAEAWAEASEALGEL